jgi:nucleotide-binding universal stress UspA family protein
VKNTTLAELMPAAASAATRAGVRKEAPLGVLADHSSIKRILAPTDLSDASEAGVRYALTAAGELGAAVTIYYVITGNTIVASRRTGKERTFTATHFYSVLEDYEMLLKRFVEDKFKDIAASVTIKLKVEFGTPETRIVKTAKTEKADLIVMATRGLRGLSRMVLGSVTEEVIRSAHCPVVAIPPSLANSGGSISVAQQ